VMKRIEIPEFFNLIEPSPANTISNLCDWFYREIEPLNKMIDEAVEVHLAISDNERLYYEPAKKKFATHKAYLIGIEEIKLDTAEDILREILKEWDRPEVQAINLSDKIKRAKEYFKRKGE